MAGLDDFVSVVSPQAAQLLSKADLKMYTVKSKNSSEPNSSGNIDILALYCFLSLLGHLGAMPSFFISETLI